jgi:hypothetical protein
MSKYKVVISTLFVEGKRYRRGDIVETELDLGTRVEPYIEPVKEEAPAPKPKRTRKRTVKVESE